MSTTIPAGLATKAGLGSALAAFITAIAALFTNHTPEAREAFAGATLALVTVLAGRYAQAIVAAGVPSSSSEASRGAAAIAPARVPPIADKPSRDAGAVSQLAFTSSTGKLVEPDVWGTPPEPGDPSLNADPSDELGAHDHPPPPTTIPISPVPT